MKVAIGVGDLCHLLLFLIVSTTRNLFRNEKVSLFVEVITFSYLENTFDTLGAQTLIVIPQKSTSKLIFLAFLRYMLEI